MGEGGRAGVNACLWSYPGLLVAAGKSQGMSYGALTCLNRYLDLSMASDYAFMVFRSTGNGANTGGN